MSHMGTFTSPQLFNSTYNSDRGNCGPYRQTCLCTKDQSLWASHPRLPLVLPSPLRPMPLPLRNKGNCIIRNVSGVAIKITLIAWGLIALTHPPQVPVLRRHPQRKLPHEGIHPPWAQHPLNQISWKFTLPHLGLF